MKTSFLAGLLALAAGLALAAAEPTNSLPPLPTPITRYSATNRPSIAARRARIEAWRATRTATTNTNNAVSTTKGQAAAERREQLRAALEERRAHRVTEVTTPSTLPRPPATNAPPAGTN